MAVIVDVESVGLAMLRIIRVFGISAKLRTPKVMRCPL